MRSLDQTLLVLVFPASPDENGNAFWRYPHRYVWNVVSAGAVDRVKVVVSYAVPPFHLSDYFAVIYIKDLCNPHQIGLGEEYERGEDGEV